MKVKVDKEELVKAIENGTEKVNAKDPWWIIVAKIIMYALGLLLAGYGTAQAATLFV